MFTTNSIALSNYQAPVKRLKKKVKEAIALLINLLGLPILIRKTICINKATIVVYHDPQPTFFKFHIRYLARHYNFISLEALVSAINSGDWSNVPSRALVITLDDGHKDNYYLVDIFRSYDVIPTIYLCSQVINTNRRFWWKTGYPHVTDLKRMPYYALLKLLRQEVKYETDKEYNDRQALNIEELTEMLNDVEFGSHTKFHPVLPKCQDSICRNEIEGSRKDLERLLGRPVLHFAYPNGAYTEREIKLLKKNGFSSGRTLNPGWVDLNSDVYQLPCMVIQDNASLYVLSAQVVGIFPLIRRFLSKFRWRDIYIIE